MGWYTGELEGNKKTRETAGTRETRELWGAGMSPVLTTERLILRPCVESEAIAADEFARMAHEGNAFNPGTVLGRSQNTGSTRADVVQDAQNSPRTLLITLKETGLPIGQAGLRPRIVPWKPYATAEVELHCTLEPAYRDGGYAQEACGALIRMAFEEMNLLRLVAVIEPGDQHFQSLLKRLGFALAPGPDSWPPKIIGVLVNPACSN